MNRKFYYKNIELWEEASWQERQSPIAGVVEAIGVNKPIAEGIDVPENLMVTGRPQEHPDYRQKTGSIEPGWALYELERRGFHYESKEIGGTRWITVFPEGEEKRKGEKYPVLAVFVREYWRDSYWSMRLLTEYREYLRRAKEDRWGLIFVVTQEPCTNRIYTSIFQEAITMYPFDLEQVWLDISPLAEKGIRLSDIPGFRYIGENGMRVNPDEYVVRKLGIPVLDISRRWSEWDSLNRGMVMHSLMNDGFEPNRLIHSHSGKRMMEGIVLEYQFGSVSEPKLGEYWKNLGVCMEIHEIKGERWISLSPADSEASLPVIAVFAEVNASNDHAPVTAFATFYEYTRLVMEGEAILTFFALEDPDSNELYCDILEEVSEKYPADMDRVYVTGHSHNAHFAFSFAKRHPELVAAAATAGIPCSLMDYAGCGIRNFSVEDDEVEELACFDLPVININGCCEGLNLFPVIDENYSLQNEFVWSVTDFRTRARYWQRRLRASRCPVRSLEEIAAASACSDKATRILGIPNDRCYTVYADGYEHYIADIKNIEGKYHLRIAGIEDMIHMTTPFMQDLAWNFMRQFARNRETLQIYELV